VGAFVAGMLGAICTLVIRQITPRIKEDASLAIVLSLFFGVGVVLFTVIQRIPSGTVAGLNQFVFGKTASLTADDVKMFASAAAVVSIVCGLLFKELSLICFDDEFAAAQGWPVFWLDAILMGLVVGVTVIGLQSVGLLLVVALPIIPASAARFWSNRIGRVAVLAACFGGLSGFLGVLISALLPHIPTGPVIVLVGSTLFVFSLLFGSRRGVVRRLWIQRTLRRRVGRDDLLRALYEVLEPKILVDGRPDLPLLTERTIELPALLATRSWTAGRLQKLLGAATRDGLVRSGAAGRLRLTPAGAEEAARAVRNHRMWEMFLIQYADIAPSHVDRDADLIEHVLEPELVAELELLMERKYAPATMPVSPHPIDSVAG
jgi:manganese/zinc/iron transport system permease protein